MACESLERISDHTSSQFASTKNATFMKIHSILLKEKNVIPIIIMMVSITCDISQVCLFPVTRQRNRIRITKKYVKKQAQVTDLFIQASVLVICRPITSVLVFIVSVASARVLCVALPCKDRIAGHFLQRGVAGVVVLPQRVVARRIVCDDVRPARVVRQVGGAAMQRVAVKEENICTGYSRTAQ